MAELKLGDQVSGAWACVLDRWFSVENYCVLPLHPRPQKTYLEVCLTLNLVGIRVLLECSQESPEMLLNPTVQRTAPHNESSCQKGQQCLGGAPQLYTLWSRSAEENLGVEWATVHYWKASFVPYSLGQGGQTPPPPCFLVLHGVASPFAVKPGEPRLEDRTLLLYLRMPDPRMLSLPI